MVHFLKKLSSNSDVGANILNTDESDKCQNLNLSVLKLLHLFLSEGFNLQRNSHEFSSFIEGRTWKEKSQTVREMFYRHKLVEMVVKAFATEMFVAWKQFVFC